MKKSLSNSCATFRTWRWLPLVAALFLGALSSEINAQGARQLPSPAGEGSGQSSLATGKDGRVYLSWLERLEGKRFALRFSTKTERGGWSAARTIAEGDKWVVNWANFPSLVALPDNSLGAHWLTQSSSSAGAYASDVQISRSFDGGRTWTPPVVPHRDATQTEHGFVSMFPGRAGALAAIWLDGREMKADAGGHAGHDGHGRGQMTLRYVTLGHDGKAAREELVLDGRVCECCQTSAALTREGPVVVYRDRSEDELRDIAIVRLLPDGKWSAPRAVHADGWRLEGCPINGPAVAASGRRVGVAWFTMGGDNVARVRVAFSNDAGATFGDPVNVDDGDPVGRVDVLMLDDGGALVSWIEKTRDGAEVRARRIWPGGRRGASISVAPSGSARSSGFPQMVRSKNTIIFSWTGASRVLTAEMSVPVR